jgi:hypothetical protein
MGAVLLNSFWMEWIGKRNSEVLNNLTAKRDFPVINILVDIIYAYLDPKTDCLNLGFWFVFRIKQRSTPAKIYFNPNYYDLFLISIN